MLDHTAIYLCRWPRRTCNIKNAKIINSKWEKKNQIRCFGDAINKSNIISCHHVATHSTVHALKRNLCLFIYFRINFTFVQMKIIDLYGECIQLLLDMQLSHRQITFDSEMMFLAIVFSSIFLTNIHYPTQ